LRKETGEVYKRIENREGEFVFERSEARAKQKKKKEKGGRREEQSSDREGRNGTE
jgi:hypothetical protein